ncbi:hypothetical protein ACHAWT_006156 [Skeletonema menzelii]
MELVMDVSKLWGRHRQSNPTSPQQLYRAVLLANDLVSKVLSIRENELDGIDSTALQSIQRNKKEARFRSSARKLSTELLAQTVALGFSRCDPKISSDAAYKAQELLDRLEEINVKYHRMENKRNLSFKEEDVFPTTRIYNHVLNCWARSMNHDAEKHATALLNRMASPRHEDVAFPGPDIFSYNNMLNLYASRGNVPAAEALLKELEDSGNGVTADVYSYTIVMNAMQRRFLSGKGDRYMKDPQRAEELLARLVRKYEESGFTNGKLCPTSVTFGTVLSMYAAADRLRKENLSMNQSRSWLTRNVEASTQRIVSDVEYLGWGAENAERVLEWIIGLSERERRSRGIDSADESRCGTSDHDMFIRPCVQHFVTTCHAWANSGKGIEAAERCESLKNRNISLYKSTGYAELRPNVLLFGVVIDAWAKANEEDESAEHAERLLDEAEQLFLHSHSSDPNNRLSNIVYNQVIDAWSRRSLPKNEAGTVAGTRAENVLLRMMDNFRITGNEQMRPDVISYTGVIKAYINSPIGGVKALELLDEMNDECMNGNRGAKPDNKAKSVVIDACIKSGLLTEAFRIFSGIDDSEKSIVMFNTILTGYKNEGRCHEAESVLRKMISLSDEGYPNCSPNTLSYYLCIFALSKGKGKERVARARALFNETIQRYRGGDISCEPSADLFNALAQVISHSEIPCRENEVLTLLEEMEAYGCTPTLESFNILIHTCSRSEEKNNMRNALQIAASAYSALDAAGLTADSVTYVSMIRAILNLMNDSEGKVQALTALFRKCCEGGFLNQHMINVLAQDTSEDDFQSITGISRGLDALQIDRLPYEWRQNSTQRKN